MIKSLQRRNSLYILIFGFLCISVFAQTPLKKHNLKKEVEELMYSNPSQAIQIAQHLLSKPTNTDEDKAKVNLLLAKTFFAKGDLSASLKSLFEEKKYTKHLTATEKVEIELLKVNIFRKLSLYKEAESGIKDCELLIQKITDENLLAEANFNLIIEKAKQLLLFDKIDEAIQLLENKKVKGKSNLEVNIWKNITLGKLYFEKKNLKLSKEFYTQALQNAAKSIPVNLFAKTNALNGLASVYFLEKEHTKVTELLNESLKNSDILSNLGLKKAILGQQISNYLALNDATNYKLANKEFIRINFEADLLEEDATNVAYNLISEDYVEQFDEAKNEYYTILYWVVALFVIVVLGGLFFLWNYYQRKKSLDEIIRYLEITRNNLINRFSEKEVVVKELSKRVIMPSDTERIILAKLKRFENSSRFINKDISLAFLAGQFDTNTKYLSEIINTHYNMNFNKYINTLRINYLVEKLKSDHNYMNYKISYIV